MKWCVLAGICLVAIAALTNFSEFGLPLTGSISIQTSTRILNHCCVVAPGGNAEGRSKNNSKNGGQILSSKGLERWHTVCRGDDLRSEK